MKSQLVMSAFIAGVSEPGGLGVRRVSQGTYAVDGEAVVRAFKEMMKADSDARALRDAAERRARRAAKRVRDRDAAERGKKR